MLSSCSRLYGRESRVEGDVIVALPPASITLSSIPRYKTQLASAVSTLRLMCVQLASLAYAIFLTCRIDQGATHVMSSDTSSLPKVLLCVICSRVAHVSHDRSTSPFANFFFPEKLWGCNESASAKCGRDRQESNKDERDQKPRTGCHQDALPQPPSPAATIGCPARTS